MLCHFDPSWFSNSYTISRINSERIPRKVRYGQTDERTDIFLEEAME